MVNSNILRKDLATVKKFMKVSIGNDRNYFEEAFCKPLIDLESLVSTKKF